MKSAGSISFTSDTTLILLGWYLCIERQNQEGTPDKAEILVLHVIIRWYKYDHIIAGLSTVAQDHSAASVAYFAALLRMQTKYIIPRIVACCSSQETTIFGLSASFPKRPRYSVSQRAFPAMQTRYIRLPNKQELLTRRMCIHCCATSSHYPRNHN